MKNLLFCILFAAANGFSPIAQTYLASADSLWKAWEIENESDSAKLETINNFNRDYYVFNHPDSGIYFADISYAYAIEKNILFGQSEALNIKGICYTLMNDYDKALSFYIQSLSIDKQIQDYKSIANKLNNIGIIYKNQGDFIKAADYYTKALELSLEINQMRIAGLAYNNLGVLMIKQGFYKESLYYILKSLEIKRSMNDQKGILISYVTLGDAYKQLNQTDLALKYLDSSLVMSIAINNNYYKSVALFNIGDCHNINRNYTIALDYFLQGIETDKEMNRISGQGFGLHRVANIHYINEDFNTALKIALESYNLQKSIDFMDGIECSAGLCAMVYAHTTHIDSAFYYLNELNGILYKNLNAHYFTYSEQQKEDHLVAKTYYFDLSHDFALTFQGSYPQATDSALNMALMSKGLSLKSTTWLRNQILSSDDSLLIDEYNSWLKLKKEITALQETDKDITELEQLAREKEKALYKNSSSFADYIKQLRPDWRSVRDNLKQGEAAIEFVHFLNALNNVYDITYAAYIVTPTCDHPVLVKLCSEDDLKKILGTLNGNNLSFVNTIYGTRTEAKTALYEKVWQPLEPFLKGIKTVYYSPSGLLHKVSFAAICKDQDIFLSDIYNFRQMGSTGNLANKNNPAFGELENFLLMGGVKYNSDTTEKEIWNYLPGSLAETESINSYLQKKKYGVNYFHSQNASEEIFKEKIVSTSVVHIATHGFFFPDPEQVRKEMQSQTESEKDLKFRGTSNYASWSFVNNKNPLMRSGIVLANANDVWQRNAFSEGEDGILTAQEVSSLDLRNTKLVVLSACETGLGDIKGSEGVFGLQRAFKMAGVKYLIMSLWQVPDKETSEFMILFYQNLIKLKDIPAAFQKTQKVMREKYDPYYWGAFVLIE